MTSSLVALSLAACLQGAGLSAGGGPSTAAPHPAPEKTREAAARAAFDDRRAEVRFQSGRMVAAEIADTEEREQLGYMFRSTVTEDEGMIFIFPRPDVHPFWMKNTLVPLDIIWMDDAFTVLHIQPEAPPCKADPCPNFGPPRKASYVLELHAGRAAREEIKAGDRLGIVLPGGEGSQR